MGFCEMKTGGAKVWGLAGGVQNVTFEKWDAKLYMKGVDEEKKETWEFTSPPWSRNLRNIVKIDDVLFFISLWIYIKIHTVIRDTRNSNRQGICQLLYKTLHWQRRNPTGFKHPGMDYWPKSIKVKRSPFTPVHPHLPFHLLSSFVFFASSGISSHRSPPTSLPLSAVSFFFLSCCHPSLLE